MTTAAIAVAAGTCLFAGCVRLAGTDGGGRLEAACRVVIPASTGTFERTLDPGAHDREAREAAAAINAAESRLRIKVVKPGTPADVWIASDQDLPGRVIGVTRGCLGPGRAPASATITLEREPPQSVDVTQVITRQVLVAMGLLEPTGHCSALIEDQQEFKKACGHGYARLSATDKAALRRIWGAADTTQRKHERGG